MSGTVSVTRGSLSGRPRPSRVVSSMYACAISAPTSRLGRPSSRATRSIFSLTSVMLTTTRGASSGWRRSRWRLRVIATTNGRALPTWMYE